MHSVDILLRDEDHDLLVLLEHLRQVGQRSLTAQQHAAALCSAQLVHLHALAQLLRRQVAVLDLGLVQVRVPGPLLQSSEHILLEEQRALVASVSSEGDSVAHVRPRSAQLQVKAPWHGWVQQAEAHRVVDGVRRGDVQLEPWARLELERVESVLHRVVSTSTCRAQLRSKASEAGEAGMWVLAGRERRVGGAGAARRRGWSGASAG